MDALPHRQTRAHKDLDLPVTLGNLPKLSLVLDEHGFTLQYRWLDRKPDRWPTASVVADAHDRKVEAPASQQRTQAHHWLIVACLPSLRSRNALQLPNAHCTEH